MHKIEFIKSYALRVFDIKEEELKKTLLLQLNIFLIITTLLIVKPTVNSLFLSELGSNALPLGYVLTAIAAVIGSYFYNKALEKAQLNRIIVFTLYISITSLIVFGLAFKYQMAKGLLLYIPYIWVAIFGLLAASQFWILANLVYNIREAKRIFGFIGSGAIAGGISGGYITSILAKFMEAEDLLFVAALLLLFCVPIVRYIWKKEVLKLNTFQVGLRSSTESENSFKLIQKSKLLSLIAVVIGLSVLVAKLIDYQYSDYASTLIEDPEELASFFGFWLSTLSVVSLIVQLFFTKKIVGMFGVGKSLLWLPTGVLLGSILLLIVPQLWVVVFIKIIDGSLKQSVNRAATELLSIPIAIDIKKKTKTFIDVVVDSIATGIAGFILIFFINGLDIPSKYVSLIIIGLISLWIYLILLLKREYINAFKNLIININGNKKPNKVEAPITSIVDSVKKVFKTGTENQILYMLKKTLEIKDNRFFYEIQPLLNHSSSKVRALAIENLYFLSKENLCQQIEPMVHDSDQLVTTAAFRYLLKHYEMDTIQLFDKYLTSNDLTIRNAALLGLSLELRNHEKLQLEFDLEAKIGTVLVAISELTDPTIVKDKTLIVLASIGNGKVTKYYSAISKHLHNQDQEIVRMALRSASKTLDAQFIDDIVKNLSKKDNRDSASEALLNYGESIIDILTKNTIDGKFKMEDARLIPSAIAKFNSQKAVKSLITLIESTEHDIKIEAIESLRKLKWNNSGLEIKDRLIIDKILDECNLYQDTLAAIHSQIVTQYKKKDTNNESALEKKARTSLIELLENRLDRQLKRIFKFLGMKYPPEDIDSVLEVILDGKEEQRIHAIEFLDNILDIQLKRELIPIAESTLIDIASEERVKKLNIRVPSELECFTNLLQRNDNKLRLAVLNLIEKTNDKKFIPLVNLYTNDQNNTLKRQANLVLKQLFNA
ncbi:AAA family ATP:ADP antiporter [Saonia flava]|uniref:ADP,ATP carrier protein n=1 Tax=Saonia flava TaxID=523696 RepID=A0A846QSE5_9FLAO|nr:Npt1/Npt2 family nucleotide transporter [Saonia flava]NJB70127.1 AAA family ATP:ADP antiporter [Saonia flava]